MKKDTMIQKIITKLKLHVAIEGERLKDHIQQIYNIDFNLAEKKAFIEIAEFCEEDAGEYLLILNLEGEYSKGLTQKEIAYFCNKETYITVGLWFDKNLCSKLMC